LRRFRRIFTVFLLVLLLTGSAAAMDTGFEVQPLSPEETARVSNKEIILQKEKPKTGSILCFDVREDGLIALGFQTPNDSEERIVCILDSNGAFQYAYRFACVGSFGLEWSGEHLLVYFVRSDLVMELDAAGNAVQWADILDTTENNRYWYTVRERERVVEDRVYRIKNDMGIFNLIVSSYSQLTVTNASAEEVLIYDVNQEQLIKTVVFTGAIALFVGCAVYIATIKPIMETSGKKGAKT